MLLDFLLGCSSILPPLLKTSRGPEFPQSQTIFQNVNPRLYERIIWQIHSKCCLLRPKKEENPNQKKSPKKRI
jgi:hypothetical protein